MSTSTIRYPVTKQSGYVHEPAAEKTTHTNHLGPTEASRPRMRRPSRSRSARRPARHACQRIDNHSLAVCASADCHQIPGRAARYTALEYPAHPSCLLREAERKDASPATPARPACRGTAANARRRDGARIRKSTLSRSRSPRRMGTDLRVGSPTRAPVPPRARPTVRFPDFAHRSIAAPPADRAIRPPATARGGEFRRLRRTG